MRKKIYVFFLSLMLIAASFSTRAIMGNAAEAGNIGTEAEVSVENTTEVTTEATIEVTTEAAAEATTEVTTEATTEATTEVTTEATTEATTEVTTEATTENTTTENDTVIAVEAAADARAESTVTEDDAAGPDDAASDARAESIIVEDDLLTADEADNASTDAYALTLNDTEENNIRVSFDKNGTYAEGNTIKYTITATNNNSFDICVKNISGQFNLSDVTVKAYDSSGKDITTGTGRMSPWTTTGYFYEQSNGEKIIIGSGQTATFTLEFSILNTLSADRSIVYFSVTRVEAEAIGSGDDSAARYYNECSYFDDGETYQHSRLYDVSFNVTTNDRLVAGQKATFNIDIINRNDFDVRITQLEATDYGYPGPGFSITNADGMNIANESHGFTSNSDEYFANYSGYPDPIWLKAGQSVSFQCEGVLPERDLTIYALIDNGAEANTLSMSKFKKYEYPPYKAQEVTVEKTDSAAPDVKLDSAAHNTLIESAFTQEEIESDDKLGVNLIVAVPSDIDPTDMDKINAAAKGGKVAMVFDLSLEMLIDGVKKGNVKILDDEITITIDIPEEFRSSGREFSMIRLHDGKTDVLLDIDTNPNTITFTTDKFSLYSLIYKDSVEQILDTIVINPDADNKKQDASQAKSDASPNTGDTAPITVIFVIMLLAAFLSIHCTKYIKK
ncbi:MAG: hypothetical protein NC428_06315 [Clostridium sp.]|nr:hypothetical protein [Clostridium sp.]